VEVVASLSQGRTAAAQCDLFTYKSVPVIFEPPCITAYLETVKFTGKECVRYKNASFSSATYVQSPPHSVQNILRVAHNMRPEMHSGLYVK